MKAHLKRLIILLLILTMIAQTVVLAADEDTKNKKKLSKINVYKDYIYGKDLDKDFEGKYYSSFMHDDDHNNGGFKALFCYVNESNK